MSDFGPFRIYLNEEVRSDIPVGDRINCYAKPGPHDAWCNQHGAVWVVAADGRHLGVKPDEFEYLTLPPDGIPLALTPIGARRLVDGFVGQVQSLVSQLNEAKELGKALADKIAALEEVEN